MVAVVTGNGLGLLNTSRTVLGGAGQTGLAEFGRDGSAAWVNASNGNLVLRNLDARQDGAGLDLGEQGPGLESCMQNWKAK